MGYKSWQDEAWAMLDGLGEFRQGVTWLANVISRARLVPAYAPTNPGDEPAVIDPDTGDPSVELVEGIGHGIGGRAELLRAGAVHLTVVGEGHFVGESAEDDLAWHFYSSDEIRKKNGVTEVRENEQDWRPLPEESVVVRVWRPHDRFHWQADSSARAALPIMRRLELLNRKIDAQIQSRLASNGILWVPSEMDFPVKEQYEDADDAFTAELIDVGTTAIKTPGSAAAAFPIITRAAGEHIAQVRFDALSTPLDAGLKDNREFEIRRLATALDVPPEVLLGMAGMNHWGAWQVEESALKTTVTSLLELICWSLTVGYLRPAMQAIRAQNAGVTMFDQNQEEIDLDLDRIVWYDLSELAVRPDRSQDAMQLGEALVITEEARLREMGFNDDDRLLDPEELKWRIGLQAVKAPATMEIGLELLGIQHAASVLAPHESVPADAASPPAQVITVPPGSLPADAAPKAPPPTNPATNGHAAAPVP